MGVLVALSTVHAATGRAGPVRRSRRVAGAIALTANALATCAWVQLRFGGLDVGALLVSLGRAVVIAAPAAYLGALVRPDLAAGWLGAAIDLTAGGAVFGALLCAGVFTLGDEPMRESLRRIARRLRGAAR